MHRTAGTGGHRSALPAGDHAACPPAVEKQDALLPRPEGLLQGLPEGQAQRSPVSGAQFLLHVRDKNSGEGLFIIAPGEGETMVNAGPGQIHTLHRRGGRTQHQQRAALGTAVFCHVPRMIFGNILRLVGRFLLFIQNHQAQILQGREDCGAGADGHPGFSGTQTLPFVVALPRP